MSARECFFRAAPIGGENPSTQQEIAEERQGWLEAIKSFRCHRRHIDWSSAVAAVAASAALEDTRRTIVWPRRVWHKTDYPAPAKLASNGVAASSAYGSSWLAGGRPERVARARRLV